MSEEVIDGDRWSDEALLHSFDFDPTGNELWGALYCHFSALSSSDSRTS